MAVRAHRYSLLRLADSFVAARKGDLHRSRVGSPFREADMGLRLFLLAAALGLASSATSAKQARARSLCEAAEQPVFSCTLRGKAKKLVSLCALPKSARGDASFRYLYGRPSKLELQYPSGGDGNGAFTRTPLRLGAMVGYAFAFTNRGYKYILYSTEGIRDARIEESGLLVQREGELHAIREMRCDSSISVLSDRKFPGDAISKWSADPTIESIGLPATR